MRILIQRATYAKVTVNESVVGAIDKGLLVFLGIEDADDESDVEWLSRKLCNLRVFEDDESVMNYSVTDVKGEILIVSQFTLHALTKKGNRPSYIKAATPEKAKTLYQKFIDSVKTNSGLTVVTGEFGATMQVSLNNDGPVTIWMDSKNKE